MKRKLGAEYKKCSWCPKYFDKILRKWEYKPAEIIENTSHGICPECLEKLYKALKKENV